MWAAEISDEINLEVILACQWLKETPSLWRLLHACHGATMPRVNPKVWRGQLNIKYGRELLVQRIGLSSTQQHSTLNMAAQAPPTGELSQLSGMWYY